MRPAIKLPPVKVTAADLNLFPETVADATAQLAVRCETHPHEFRRGECSWCGKPEAGDDH